MSAVHPDSVGLAEDLLALVPGSGERRVYLGHAGSDANDVALRACRHASGRRTIIAFVIIAFVAFWLGRLFLREEAAEPTKQCPYCREDNKVDATKCRACASTI